MTLVFAKEKIRSYVSALAWCSINMSSLSHQQQPQYDVGENERKLIRLKKKEKKN